MFYLPRICEHCLNPSCAASCPSGAIYKRAEDGIVLVDQDRCRGWRMCVSGCPYKKVYFNHRTGKAEKCTFCFPRVEVGIPTVCSETCVGRLRYIGADALRRRPGAAGRRRPPTSTTCTRRSERCSSTRTTRPSSPPAERAGIPRDWIEAAQRSPVYALISTYRVALPLHPEYRTMPMVWYIPPLSPVVDVVRDTGHDAEDRGQPVRAPSTRCASRSTTSPSCSPPVTPRPVNAVLRRLAAMRSYMRDINLGREPDESIPAAVGHERRADLRHVPAARDRQVRRAVRHPGRARRAGAAPGGAGHRVQPGLRGRARAWAARGRSASRPAARRPSRWRTSTCSATGRPPTPWPARLARRAGSTCSTGTARDDRAGLFPPADPPDSPPETPPQPGGGPDAPPPAPPPPGGDPGARPGSRS